MAPISGSSDIFVSPHVTLARLIWKKVSEKTVNSIARLDSAEDRTNIFSLFAKRKMNTVHCHQECTSVYFSQ